MDQNTMVEGGWKGLVKVAEAFRRSRFPVKAIYLVKRTTTDGETDWVLNVVLSPFKPSDDRHLIYELVRLRREKRLPRIDEVVRVNAVSPDDIEASRIIDYARRLGEPPLVIQNTYWDGLYIEYALVAEYDHSTAAAA